MHFGRCLVLLVAALPLLLGVAAGCATAPALEAQPATPQVSASESGARATHAHHHGGAATHSRVHSESDPPTSFAKHPDVGTEFTCPVSGGTFEVEPHTRVSVYEGRYYAMCCGGCQQDFDADPAHFVEALEEQRAAQ